MKLSDNDGISWTGDWRLQIRTYLVTHGWASLKAFTQSMPLATLEQLSRYFDSAEVTPRAVERYLVEETEKTGRYCELALDLLVRALHTLPGGWPAGRSWKATRPLRDVLVAWQVSTHNVLCELTLHRIADELLADLLIQPGWLPQGPDDPLLQRVFAKHWPSAN